MNHLDDTAFTAAVKYARLGYAVLPLAPGEKRPYARLVPNGLKDATHDPRALRRWWTHAPNAGIGILPPAQVLVLDFDSLEAWEQLTNEYPDLLLAPQQKTPRGGRHVFLRLPDGIGKISASTALLRGVDIRGMGKAYLVAAPTRLPNGAYEWVIDLPPPDKLPLPPDPLLAALLPTPTPPPEYQSQRFRGVTGDKRTRLLEGLLRWACARVASTPVGERHITLLRYSRLVGGYLHHGLDLERAAQALTEAGMRAGLPPAEAARAARDGLNYGQKAPIKLSNSTPTSKAETPEPAKKLVELATTHAELWHDERQRGWATVEIGGHKENWPLASRRFELWLSNLFYEVWDKPLNARTLTDARGALEAKAIFNGAKHPVYLRVAHRPNELWLDLGREGWEAVHVTADGWEIRAPEVRFRRSGATGALPIPEKGGGGEALRALFEPWDLDEGARALLIAWLLGALGAGPYPVLALAGEQGSGKSTLARMLQRLVDPGGDLTTLPRDSGELFLAAKNSHVLAFDNVSSLSPWLSDDLCKLSTGGTLRRRQLYSDEEEMFFKGKNPVILNGITDYVTSQDLLDRSILLTLPPVVQHRLEVELRRDFDAAHPQALGDLLDLVALALREYPRTPTPNIRMADFARFALAAESGYAPSGTFEAAFADTRAEALQINLDNDPIYPLLLQLLERGRFEGSAGELLGRLNEVRGDRLAPPFWPRTPHAMASWLKRSAPALRRVGVQVGVLPRQKSRRGWFLEKADEQPGTVTSGAVPHQDTQPALLDTHDAPSQEAKKLAADAIKLGASALRLYVDDSPKEFYSIEGKSQWEIAQIAHHLIKEVVRRYSPGGFEIRAEWSGGWPETTRSEQLWSVVII